MCALRDEQKGMPSFVDYNDNVHGTFAQYDRRQAGYYPGISRRARRIREMAAWAAGVRQQPVLLGERCGAPCGAPGLLGGAPTTEALAERRAAAYPAMGALP
jgi:hypothetical protein